ncbi:MAG: Maf family protein [Synergistaceae bacterium]|jgi:septum formation protein|nr:Maf family protein [Synergistaceae bacterium]
MPVGVDVVLASGSPRRRELLTALGWGFRAVVPQIDETPRPGEAPEALCARLARMKADSVAIREGNALVIAADTVVVMNRDILGKPRDKSEGLKMILSLQGRTHEVLTGLSLRWRKRALDAVERTRVTFRPLNETAARAYAATGEGMDKAGAYAIQGKGSLLVSSIKGDYFNVVGLPLCKLGAMVGELGLSLPSLWT